MSAMTIFMTPFARVGFGRKDAFTVLREHYADIEALLDRLAVTPMCDAAIRESLFSRFAEKLLLHLELEETVFYPEIRGVASRETVRGTEELDTIRRLLEELLGTPATDGGFPARVAMIGKLLQIHAARDERRLYPLCATLLGDRRLADLGENMRYYLMGDCGMLPLDEAASAETHLFI